MPYGVTPPWSMMEKAANERLNVFSVPAVVMRCLLVLAFVAVALGADPKPCCMNHKWTGIMVQVGATKQTTTDPVIVDLESSETYLRQVYDARFTEDRPITSINFREFRFVKIRRFEADFQGTYYDNNYDYLPPMTQMTKDKFKRYDSTLYFL